jgi:glycosyltransferase involved in cell wall biosynthesis
MLTVCICTHKPNPVSLERVVRALRDQTLAPTDWELLIVESGCRDCVEGVVELSWKPGVRLLYEERPGKTFAMAMGVREAKGDAVVFVDDDNVLAPDYLINLTVLLQSHPKVAVFSAEITPEYARTPPEWIGAFARFLAIRSLDRDVWANVDAPSASPVGAGMCARREVADQFVRLLERDRFLHDFGRSSTSLRAGTDDTIFGWIAFDLGFGCGAFKALRHTHLIGAQRIEHSYLRRIAKDITYSHTVLAWHFGVMKGIRLGQIRRHAFSCVRAALSCSPYQLSARIACFKGFLLALRDTRSGRIPLLSGSITEDSR